MEPDSLIAKWYFVQLLLWNHRVDEANKFIDEFAEEAPGHAVTQLILNLPFRKKRKKPMPYSLKMLRNGPGMISTCPDMEQNVLHCWMREMRQ